MQADYRGSPIEQSYRQRSTETGQIDRGVLVDRTADVRVVRRTERLIVREYGDEVMVYDLDTDQVHCLRGVTAAVWAAAAEATSLRRLTKVTSTDAASVSAALTQLGDLGLVRHAETAGLSRRNMLR